CRTAGSRSSRSPRCNGWDRSRHGKARPRSSPHPTQRTSPEATTPSASRANRSTSAKSSSVVWFSSKRAPRATCALLLAAALGGCAATQSGIGAPVSAPANIRAAAPLDAQRLVVVAGNDRVRTVHIVRVADGKDEKIFGVSPQTTSVVALSPKGPLILGY